MQTSGKDKTQIRNWAQDKIRLRIQTQKMTKKEITQKKQ